MSEFLPRVTQKTWTKGKASSEQIRNSLRSLWDSLKRRGLTTTHRGIFYREWPAVPGKPNQFDFIAEHSGDNQEPSEWYKYCLAKFEL